MSVDVHSGRMTIKNTSGVTLFDSDDGMFHVLSAVSGSVSIPAYVHPGNVNANVSDSYLLGSCNANCTDAIGAVKFTLNTGAAGLAYDRWHTIMGGSIMWLIDGHGLLGTPDPNINLRQLVTYSLRVAAGKVYLDRRLLISAASQGTYEIRAHTLEFKLKCGLYT
jgi:hypothetical protein